MKILLGIFIYIILVFLIYILRPNSYLNTHDNNLLSIIFSCLLCILITTIPMYIIFKFRHSNADNIMQYNMLVDSLLKGQLNLDLYVDPKLLTMENPYDTDIRDALNINYTFDASFYKGKYYTYFGIVPAILLYLPCKVLFNINLSNVYATMFFVSISICGMFYLFYILKKRYFNKIPLSIYLSLSIAFIFVSFSFAMQNAEIYATAIISAICMEVWSICFFTKSIHVLNNNKKYFFVFNGALLGALAFGCRPTIALTNLFLIPFIIYLWTQKSNIKDFYLCFIIICLPYILIGLLLMLYNYLRFENVFEFGATYQLTSGNIQKYTQNSATLNNIMNGLLSYWLKLPQMFGGYGGVLINAPIFILAVICLFIKKTYYNINKNYFLVLLFSGFLIILLISLIEVLFSPVYNERYKSDIYWISCIASYVVLGLLCDHYNSNKLNSLISILGLATLIFTAVHLIVPVYPNFTLYYPKVFDFIISILTFGLI